MVTDESHQSCSIVFSHYSNGFVIRFHTLEKEDSIIAAEIEPVSYARKFGAVFKTGDLWKYHGFALDRHGDIGKIKYQKNRAYLPDSVYNEEIYDPDFDAYFSAFGMGMVFSPGGENHGRGFEESKAFLERALDSSEVKLLMRSINPVGRLMGYELSNKFATQDFIRYRNRIDWDTTTVSILNGCLGNEAKVWELLDSRFKSE